MNTITATIIFSFIYSRMLSEPLFPAGPFQELKSLNFIINVTLFKLFPKEKEYAINSNNEISFCICVM
jgi:hypothetical protein